MRTMNLVLIGSFCAASSNASFATLTGTPSHSNRIRPGSTTAAQNSGLPLPLPILTSWGLRVIGLSGNTLIHTFPSLFILRVSACLAASICLLVSQMGSSAFSANEPKEIVAPLLATWRMRPFCAFPVFAPFRL